MVKTVWKFFWKHCFYFLYWTSIFLQNISLFAENTPTFFSTDQISLEKGFFASQIYIPEIKNFREFEMIVLSYNEYRDWEELRIKGTVLAISDRNWELTPNFCTVYAQKKAEKRWTLIQAFDCNHLKYNLKLGPRGIATLNPGPNLENNLQFKPQKIGKEGYFFQIVKAENEQAFAWGKNARYISKNSLAQLVTENEISTSKYKVLIPIDTMLILENKENTLEVGNIIYIPKETKSGLFP